MAEAAGHVWEWTVPESQVAAIRQRHATTSSQRCADGVRLRLVAEQAPSLDAMMELPPLAVAKIGLYQAHKQGLRKAELARRLDVHLPQVDRRLDLRHRAKLEQVAAALNAVGHRIELTALAA